MPRDGLTVRCDECIEAILRLNAPRLTRLLLEELYVPERLSERLVTDLDAGVAMAASERLERADPGRKAALAPTVELPPVEPIPVAETATTIRGACSPYELDGQLAVGTDGARPVAPAAKPDGDPGAGNREPEALEPVVAVPATGAPGDEPDDEWGERW